MKRARRRRQVHVTHCGKKNRTREQRQRMRTRAGIRKLVREVRRKMGQPSCPAWWILLTMGGAAVVAFNEGKHRRGGVPQVHGPRFVDQPPELRADFEAGFGRARR